MPAKDRLRQNVSGVDAQKQSQKRPTVAFREIALRITGSSTLRDETAKSSPSRQ